MKETRTDSQGNILLKGESQRPNGLYYYRWTDRIGIRRGFYAESLEVLRLIETRMELAERNGLVDYRSATVNDLYEVWLEQKRGIRENTLYNYRQVYECHVRNSLGKKKILRLRATDVKRFYFSLHDIKRLSFNTLDHIQNVLYQVLQTAVSDGFIQSNPAEKALKEFRHEKAMPKKEISVLEAEQEKAFLEFCREERNIRRWYMVFAVMLGTGMRVGELCALTHSDVDFRKGIIHVERTLTESGTGKAIHPAKTKAGIREIPMLERVRQALLAEIRYQNARGIRCNKEIDGVQDFFFLNRFGNALNQQNINRAIHRAVMEYNCKMKENGCTDELMLPPITSHAFRKTFLTRMCEAGMNMRDIMQIAGHSDIQTTMSMYTKVTERMKKADLEKLEEYVKTI